MGREPTQVTPGTKIRTWLLTGFITWFQQSWVLPSLHAAAPSLEPAAHMRDEEKCTQKPLTPSLSGCWSKEAQERKDQLQS